MDGIITLTVFPSGWQVGAFRVVGPTDKPMKLAFMKANFIGLSVGPTTLNAPTCHPDGKTVRVMIPSIVIL